MSRTVNNQTWSKNLREQPTSSEKTDFQTERQLLRPGMIWSCRRRKLDDEAPSVGAGSAACGAGTSLAAEEEDVVGTRRPSALLPEPAPGLVGVRAVDQTRPHTGQYSDPVSFSHSSCPICHKKAYTIITSIGRRSSYPHMLEFFQPASHLSRKVGVIWERVNVYYRPYRQCQLHHLSFIAVYAMLQATFVFSHTLSS